MITFLIAAVVDLTLANKALAAALRLERERYAELEREYKSFQEEAFTLVEQRDRLERAVNYISHN